MSRNFELLNQLELEAAASEDKLPAPAAETVYIRQAVETEKTDLYGQQMSQLVRIMRRTSSDDSQGRFVFCGADQENDSSSVCADAARALVIDAGRPVCLVDANVRARRLSNTYAGNGVARYSGKITPMGNKCVEIARNLWFAGIDLFLDGRGLLVPSEELRNRILQLQEDFDYVLIDVPGLAVCKDALLLGSCADAAILVVEAHSTRKLTALRAKHALEGAGIKLLGTVLNNRTFAIPEALYRRI